MQNLFSYPLKLEDMSTGVQTFRLEADTKQLAGIAAVMQVPAVKSFCAEIQVRLRKKEHTADVRGRLDAEVEQTSVISLENFVKPYHADFELKFDTKMTPAEYKELEADWKADVPDILEDGKIDLAAVAMEQLALVLDDFPRKDGEVFSFTSEFDEETPAANNPFAVLKKIKK